MIREIKTNVGNFGTFRDIMLFMREEKMLEIDVLHIRLWSGDYINKRLLGNLTFDEILLIL